MLLDLLNLLPQNVSDGTRIIALVGTAVGGVLWVAGVKFSRPLLTLVTVLLGAVIGMRLPKWFHWNVSGAGPAVGGAVLLGVSGFVLHRMWVGITLGITLAISGTLAIWLTMHGNQSWTWPTWDETSTACSYAKTTWANVPPNMARLIPFACVAAIVSALASCIIWPRFTTALSWSALGVTLLFGLGLTAIAKSNHNNWLEKAPQKTWSQLAIVGVMLLLGLAIQMKLSPAEKKPAKNESDKLDDPQ